MVASGTQSGKCVLPTSYVNNNYKFATSTGTHNANIGTWISAINEISYYIVSNQQTRLQIIAVG